MRSFFLSAFLGPVVFGLMAVHPPVADAQGIQFHFGSGPRHHGFSSPYHFNSYSSPYQSFSHFGLGHHDVRPHWHRTTTPYGSNYWYGTGPHDHVPHQHLHTPYGSFGYHQHPWGHTKSYYSTYPRFFSPW